MTLNLRERRETDQHSPASLACGLLLGCLMLVAILAFVWRLSLGLFGTTSVWGSLVVVAASWLAATAIALALNLRTRSLERMASISGLVVIAALAAWSASVPIAIMLAMPIVAVVGLYRAARYCGWSLIQSSPTQPATEQSDSPMAHPVSPPATLASSKFESAGERDPSLAPTLAENADGNQAGDSLLDAQSSRDCELESEHEPGDGMGDEDLWERVQTEVVRDASLSANITRWNHEDGSNTLVGNLRCHIPAGESSTLVQLPVWPFFAGEPDVHCSVVDDSDVRAKVIQNHANGIAVEVRRIGDEIAASAHEVVLEIVALCAAEPERHSNAA